MQQQQLPISHVLPTRSPCATARSPCPPPPSHWGWHKPGAGHAARRTRRRRRRGTSSQAEGVHAARRMHACMHAHHRPQDPVGRGTRSQTHACMHMHTTTLKATHAATHAAISQMHACMHNVGLRVRVHRQHQNPKPGYRSVHDRQDGRPRQVLPAYALWGLSGIVCWAWLGPACCGNCRNALS